MFYSQVFFFRCLLLCLVRQRFSAGFSALSDAAGSYRSLHWFLYFLLIGPVGPLGRSHGQSFRFTAERLSSFVVGEEKNQRTARKFKSIQQPQKPWDYNNSGPVITTAAKPLCSFQSHVLTLGLYQSSFAQFTFFWLVAPHKHKVTGSSEIIMLCVMSKRFKSRKNRFHTDTNTCSYVLTN